MDELCRQSARGVYILGGIFLALMYVATTDAFAPPARPPEPAAARPACRSSCVHTAGEVFGARAHLDGLVDAVAAREARRDVRRGRARPNANLASIGARKSRTDAQTMINRTLTHPIRDRGE